MLFVEEKNKIRRESTREDKMLNSCRGKTVVERGQEERPLHITPELSYDLEGAVE